MDTVKASQPGELAAATCSETAWTSYHMSINIEGVLRWPDKTLRDLFKEAEGGKRPASYVRDWLKLQLSKGKRVLPMGKPCEGWSDIDGCPGHPCEHEISAPNMTAPTE